MSESDYKVPACHGTEYAVAAYIAKRGGKLLRASGITADCFHDYRIKGVVGVWFDLSGRGLPIDYETTIMTVRQLKLDLGSPQLGGDDQLALIEIYGGKTIMPEFEARISEDMESYGGFQALCDRLHELRKLRIIAETCRTISRRAQEQQDGADELRVELLDRMSWLETRRNHNQTEQAVREVLGMLVEREIGGTISLPTGIPAWDISLHGIFPKRFYAIGARPKVGKSALIEQIAMTLHDAGEAVLIFQRDMSLTDMVGRMACRSAGLVFEDFMSGNINARHSQRIRSAACRINPELLRIYSPANLTASEMAMIVEREHSQHKVKVFFLDLFQRLVTGRDKVEGLVDAANTIRQVIQTTGVSGVIIAEVTKESDKTGGRPHAGQFKYCDGLFSACDTAVMLWTDDDPKQLVDRITGEHRRQKIYFTVDANRGGAVSDETMYFDRPHMRFFSTEDGAE